MHFKPKNADILEIKVQTKKSVLHKKVLEWDFRHFQVVKKNDFFPQILFFLGHPLKIFLDASASLEPALSVRRHFSKISKKGLVLRILPKFNKYV